MGLPDIFDVLLNSLSQVHPHITFILLSSMGATTLWALHVAAQEWEAHEAAVQRYHTLFDQVSDGVVVAPIDGGKVLAANHRAVELSGYTPHELCKLSLHDLFSATPNNWTEEASRLGQGKIADMRLRRGSGETVHVTGHIVAVREGRRRFLQVIFQTAQDPLPTRKQRFPSALGHHSTSTQAQFPRPTQQPSDGRKTIAAAKPPENLRPAMPSTSITIERIIRLVAENFGVRPEELTQNITTPKHTMARRVVMYLATHVSSIAPEEVGRILNGRSQVAVSYGARLIADLLDQDPSMRQRIEHLRNRLMADSLSTKG
jgi:PAS domain S-box-containing protein